jgi:hypothetical protein
VKTEIAFVDGKSVEFDEDAEVKMSDHGIEVIVPEGEGKIRVLFPWGRIEKVTQRGAEVGYIHHF